MCLTLAYVLSRGAAAAADATGECEESGCVGGGGGKGRCVCELLWQSVEPSQKRSVMKLAAYTVGLGVPFARLRMASAPDDEVRSDSVAEADCGCVSSDEPGGDARGVWLQKRWVQCCVC